MPDKHIVIVKWVDAKFCPGIHSKEDILEHNIVGLLFGGHVIPLITYADDAHPRGQRFHDIDCYVKNRLSRKLLG